MTLKKFTEYTLAFITLCVGIYSLPLKSLDNFNKIPGDLGDARFNNYVLEHGHLYLSGEVENYWDAPFMFPEKNTIAYSDNLFGTLPIYSLFRSFDFSRELAFQYWLLVLFALNFIGCWIALKWWKPKLGGIAIVAAYLYAFSIFNAGQLVHVQVFPRFVAPFIIVLFISFLQKKNWNYLSILIGLLVYQFYCGIYLGFFVLYLLVFIAIAYLIVERTSVLKNWHLPTKKIILIHLGTWLISLLLLTLLFKPYLEAKASVGVRSWEEIRNSLPTWRSYFAVSQVSWFWESLLYESNTVKIKHWWNHCVFIGGTPWLFLLTGIILWGFKKISKEYKWLLLALITCLVFTLRIGDFTLYKIFTFLPGFSTLRSMDRVMNIVMILFGILIILPFENWSLNRHLKNGIVLILLFLVVLENQTNNWAIKKYDVAHSQKEVGKFKNKILDKNPERNKAIAFTKLDVEGLIHENHLNVMLACQELGYPTVNAYTGIYPETYLDYFYSGSVTSLYKWLEFKGASLKNITLIPYTEKEIIDEFKAHIKACNGKFINGSYNHEHNLLANEVKPNYKTEMTIILYSDSTCAIKTKDNKYWSIEKHIGTQIKASKDGILPSCYFDLHKNKIKIKYFPYIQINSSSEIFISKTDSCSLTLVR